MQALGSVASHKNVAIAPSLTLSLVAHIPPVYRGSTVLQHSNEDAYVAEKGEDMGNWIIATLVHKHEHVYIFMTI